MLNALNAQLSYAQRFECYAQRYGQWSNAQRFDAGRAERCVVEKDKEVESIELYSPRVPLGTRLKIE